MTSKATAPVPSTPAPVALRSVHKFLPDQGMKKTGKYPSHPQVQPKHKVHHLEFAQVVPTRQTEGESVLWPEEKFNLCVPDGCLYYWRSKFARGNFIQVSFGWHQCQVSVSRSGVPWKDIEQCIWLDGN